ncbi:MAG: HPF/RaiA family ribosome-associated protein [Candidatus Paceibacterota bacterium]|jgi:ribosome-associated translation inhibitor RaiA
MNINIKATKYTLTPENEAIIEEKLVAPLRLLGEKYEKADDDEMLLDIDVEQAPPEGRSSTPCRLVANLRAGGRTYHAEAVKPSPESAADRVRSTLEAEIRREHGRTRRLFKKGGTAIKRILRFGS